MKVADMQYIQLLMSLREFLMQSADRNNTGNRLAHECTVSTETIDAIMSEILLTAKPLLKSLVEKHRNSHLTTLKDQTI